mmetsp:Transcript_88047/g.139084  ORF Transcript_88047/g.139084 Transcript_88047/m.139084 type:complete len:359 (-) Transcript_88047:177-1253(-)
MGLDDDQFVAVNSISPNLRCPICSGVFDDPVFASGQPCHCTFCRHCITSWLAKSRDEQSSRSCPICRKRLDLSTMVPNSMLQNFICEQMVYCRYRSQGCYWTGRHDQRKGHDVDCLVRRLFEKDNIIHALSQQLEDQDRVIQELRREASEHAEMQVWVSNFLASAPPCMAALLPASSGESSPSSSSMAFPDRRAKLKKVVKEGSKTGIERESATILGGLEFFCTAVEEPTGDVEMLMECLTAMNAKSDTMQQDHIGKMLFSAGASQLAVVAYVPPAKHRQVSSAEWLQVVLHAFGGRVLKKAPDVSVGIVKSSPDKDYLRLQACAIDEAKSFLRRKGLLPEESDGMVLFEESDEDETY